MSTINITKITIFFYGRSERFAEYFIQTPQDAARRVHCTKQQLAKARQKRGLLSVAPKPLAKATKW